MKQRSIPTGYYEVLNKHGVAIYYKDDIGPKSKSKRFISLCYYGDRSINSLYHNFYYDAFKRDEHTLRTYNSKVSRDADKIERREKDKAKRLEALDNYKVGTILYSSWGYDQTNIDFYQVTNVKGQFVWIKEINSKFDGEPTSWCSQNVMPIPDSFKGKEMKKRISTYGLRICSSSSACLWDGKSKHSSWGH